MAGERSIRMRRMTMRKTGEIKIKKDNVADVRAEKKTVERNDESLKRLRRRTRRKKKEGRKVWRIEGKTSAQVEKEKRVCGENRGVEGSRHSGPKVVNEDEKWGFNSGTRKSGARSTCEAGNGASSRGGQGPNWSKKCGNNQHRGVQGKKNDPLGGK